MKKLLLLCLVFCLSIVDGLAQNYDETRLEALTNEFIQKSGTSDALSLMTNIKSFYSSLSNGNKKKMLSFYVSKVSSLLESEKKDNALAVIHLYQNLADKNDDKLPTLLYIKGNIYAEKVDSIRLTRTIEELHNIANNRDEKAIEYIDILVKKKQDICNYVPQYKGLDGIWVADGLLWDKTIDGKRSIANLGQSSIGMMLVSNQKPDIFMRIQNDLEADTISICIDKQGYFAEQLASRLAKITINVKDNYSQLVVPYASDSIYILWCSERINKNSPELAGILRGTVSATAAAVNAELAQKNKYTWSDSFWGGLASTAVEVGINSILDALFTPSKKMFALEARLKIENDFLLTGILTWKYSKIKADGGSKYEELHSRIALTRWLPESKVAFECFPLLVHPSVDIENFKKDESTRMAYYVRTAKDSKQGFFYTRAINNEQYKWLMLYNDSILKASGSMKTAIPANVQPNIGITYDDIPQKVQKKYNIESEKGVIVTSVEDISAANAAGLKKKDIILAIDNIEIKGKFSMMSYLSNKKIGDWIKIKIQRGKKTLNLLLRVTWK